MHALGCSPKPHGKSPLLKTPHTSVMGYRETKKPHTSVTGFREMKTPHTSVIGYREMKVLHTLFIRHKKNQDSIERESLYLLVNIHSAGRCYAGYQQRKLISWLMLAATLPGKICPLGHSGRSLSVLINHTGIGLEALSARRNTHLVLLNPIKTH